MCFVISLSCGLAIPFCGLDKVFAYAASVCVTYAKIALRSHVSLLRSFTIPACCFCFVCRYHIALVVIEAEVVLRD